MKCANIFSLLFGNRAWAKIRSKRSTWPLTISILAVGWLNNAIFCECGWIKWLFLSKIKQLIFSTGSGSRRSILDYDVYKKKVENKFIST